MQFLRYFILAPVKVAVLALAMCVVFMVSASFIMTGGGTGNGSADGAPGSPGQAEPLSTGAPDDGTGGTDARDTARALEQLKAAGALLGASLIQGVAIAWLAARSRLRRPALAAVLGGLFFVTMGVMSQSETVVFLEGARKMVPRLLLVQAAVAVVAGAGASVLFGARGKEAVPARWSVTGRDWLWVLPVLCFTYLAVYLVAGYCFIWTDSDARHFYGGGGPVSLFAQIGLLVRESPGLLLFQLARGAVWTGIAYAVVTMWRGARWELGLSLVVFLALAFASLLVVPNPIIPADIRRLHLYEITTSNTVFALVAAGILTRRRAGTGGGGGGEVLGQAGELAGGGMERDSRHGGNVRN